jgi:excinuclease UvrABC ATPase subunit
MAVSLGQQNQRDTLKTVIKVMKNQIIEQILKELSKSQLSVNNSFPSVYTKQDVIHLLDEFADTISTYVFENVEEKKSSRSMSLEGVEELSELLIKTINNKIERLDSNDVVDYDSACFSIGYNNQVEIDTIDFNDNEITDIVEITIDEVLRDFFTPEEEAEHLLDEVRSALIEYTDLNSDLRKSKKAKIEAASMMPNNINPWIT